MAVAQHVLVHGPATRVNLGEALELSYASMSRVARSLVRRGVMVEDVDRDAAMGRPSQLLSIVPGARHAVGVKITRDTAYAVACDMFGTILSSAAAPMPEADADGVVPIDASISVVARLVQRLSRRVPHVDCVGVCIGGPVVDQKVVQATFLGWYNVDLPALVEAAVKVPVAISNDVAALCREQLWFGAGRTHSTFAVITVGAGLGFGMVREGRVIEQLIDDGFLLWHSPLDASGPQCRLGHAGCVAAYLNRDDVESRAAEALGRPLSFAELAALAQQGDPVSAALINEAASALGHLVATCAGALQTDRVVLAGENVAALTGPRSPMHTVIADRVGISRGRAPKATLEISTALHTFDEWAQGAAVVAIQRVLGAA